MIPYLDDRYEMLRMLSDAIKGVYASVYFRDSKACCAGYVECNRSGENGGYPARGGRQPVLRPLLSFDVGCSPFAQLLPLGEKAEEGTVNLALGLANTLSTAE